MGITIKKKATAKKKAIVAKKKSAKAPLAKKEENAKTLLSTAGQDVEAKQAHANVSVEDSTNGTVTETIEKVGEAKKYTEPTCNVGMSMGFTKNTGNYENVKVTVSLHVPCLHDEIEDSYEYAKTWVDDKLTAVREEMDEE